MQDLNDKVTGGLLTAAEWNEVPSEIQNVITSTNQSLSSGDLNQLGKGIAEYAANGDAYTDSGSVDVYVLTTIGGKQAPTGYVDGMWARFVTTNTGTGAATVNIAGLGVKNIKLVGGADPAAGDIDGRVELIYDTSNDWFELNLAEEQKQIATTLEAQQQVSDNTLISPLKLFESLQGANQALSAMGYQKLPGGLMMQWGTGVGDTVVTYPLAFTQVFGAYTVSIINAYVTDTHLAASPGLTNFTPRSGRITGGASAVFNSHAFNWFAIGV